MNATGLSEYPTKAEHLIRQKSGCISREFKFGKYQNLGKISTRLLIRWPQVREAEQVVVKNTKGAFSLVHTVGRPATGHASQYQEVRNDSKAHGHKKNY